MIAVDGSAVDGRARARERSTPSGRRCEADLTELKLDEPVDADLLERGLPLDRRPPHAVRAPARALRPGGRLVAQCGGAGNLAAVPRRGQRSGRRRGHLATRPTWRAGRALELRRRRGDRERLGARASTDVTTWLEPQPIAPARAARLPALDLPRPPPRAAARGAARRPSSTRCAERCGPARPRLRAAQHRAGDRPRIRRLGQRIVTLPGDGIGPEIMAAAAGARTPSATSSSTSTSVGGASIDAHGTALTHEVLDACRASDAVLLAAVGGPKWDTTDPDAPRPEQGLLGLRKGSGLFANLRPVRPSPALLDASPLKRERIEGTDLLVVRELTGGIYFGDARPRRRHRARHLRLQRGRDRAHRARGVPAGAPPGHERRQGERPRDLAAVARGRRAVARRPRRSRSTTCSSTTPPCSSSRAPPSST